MFIPYSNFSANKINDKCLSCLSNSLQFNSSLQSLDLKCFVSFTYCSDNKVFAEGAKYLSNSLQYNSSLLKLNLYSVLFVVKTVQITK